MNQEIERYQPVNAIAAREELSVEDMVAQVQKIQGVMSKLMHEGEHYGVIPGTERKDKEGNDISKRSLYKPGAEKLCLMFRLDPQYVVERTRDGNHLDALATCTLWHITSGQRVASGVGSCSTRETKYAYRQATRVCPTCKTAAIIKGRDEYGGGWVCFKKKDGCGAKFGDGDPSIEGQVVGRIANEDVADQHNTVVKMACKRALVAAVLNATAASDIFTQDLDDPEDDDEERADRRVARAERGSGKPAKPGASVDPVVAARSKALQQLYAKKYGDNDRDTRLMVAGGAVGRQLSSFNDLTKEESQTLFHEWNHLSDHRGDPKPAKVAVQPAAPARDNGLPFGDVDLPVGQAERLLAIAYEIGRATDDARISFTPADSKRLGLIETIYTPDALVATGKADKVEAAFQRMLDAKNGVTA